MNITRPSDVLALLGPIMEQIAALTGDRVIAEGGPRPAEGPYCQLRWMHIDPLPQNEGEYERDADTDQPLAQTLRNEWSGSLRVTFLGEAAFDSAVAAWGWLSCDQRTFDLWKEPLGCGEIGRITEASREYGAEWQGRAFFDIPLTGSFEAVYPVDWFNTTRLAVNHTTQGGRNETGQSTEPDGSRGSP